MQVKNKRPFEMEIPNVGFVEGGGVIEVPDDLGEALTEQVDAWEVVEGHRGGRLTVDEVLSDVGEDPDKARQALAVERESEQPRKSLVSRLEEIMSNAEEKR